MAYRRRPGMGRSSTFKEDIYQPPEEVDTAASYSPSPSQGAHAIRASAAHRHSSHSSAYVKPAFTEYSKKLELLPYVMGCIKNRKVVPMTTHPWEVQMKQAAFGGVLARKAKSILEEDNASHHSEYTSKTRPEMFHSSRIEQVEISKNMDNPAPRKGLGDIIGNALGV